MALEYVEHQSYGDLSFGMSADQVHSILGDPSLDKTVAETALLYADPSNFAADDLRYMESVRHWEYEASRSDNTKPSVIFMGDALHGIRLFHHSDTLSVRGVDLFGKKRPDIIVSLAQFEEREALLSREVYHFPATGLEITRPIYWREGGTITFLSPHAMAAEIAFEKPISVAKTEITGKER